VNNGALWDHSRHWLNLRPIYAFGAAPIGLPLLVPGRRGLTMVPDEME
jgi:hypothetical protein